MSLTLIKCLAEGTPKGTLLGMAKSEKPLPTNQKGLVPIVWEERRQRFKLTIRKGGKKCRTFHRTREEADAAWRAFVNKVEAHGKRAAEYDAAAHTEYEEAKRIVGGADLREVARFYKEHHPENATEISVGDAIALFKAQKEARKVSSRHLETLRDHLSRFDTTFGNSPVRNLNSNTILKWLHEISEAGLAPRTIHNFHDSISNFANWCARRGYATRPFTDGIHESDLPIIPTTPKGVLSITQTRSMMAWLENNRPHFVAWHAIQIFAGLRNAEAGRFQWEWIDLDRQIITLPGWIFDQGEAKRGVKTGDDWALHDLPENLWLWLQKYRPLAKKFQHPSPNAILEIRRRHFPQLSSPIPQWPQNAMRHTFCTMMISLHSDAAKVANWSRHTNARQLYKSYVAKLVAKEEAEAFFSIVPDSNP